MKSLAGLFREPERSSPKMLAEDACTRKVGLHHLTLFEGLDVACKNLQEFAKPDIQVLHADSSLFEHLAKFVEELKNLEEGNLNVALSGVVASRNKLRAFVTQGMAP